MRRWNFFISETHLKKLRQHARKAEMSISELLRDIIRTFLKTKKSLTKKGGNHE